ncbi:MAG: zinc ribbon domain-containing protein [Candidatus Heimdallarchaeota archaeon]|nr:zinc ribbon domain-containing protein [Candidatus Heimdallarchaeota archaeon]MCK5143084.1 zinc ribbon domain-containing protein [Candidatus Heimdallarchaeota archaeon]
MVNNKYPVTAHGEERFSFFWMKLAVFGMMLYYIIEMINRVLFIFFYEDQTGEPIFSQEVMDFWRIADSVFYAFMFILIAIQVIQWRSTNIGLENKKKARNAIFALLITAFSLGLYEALLVLQQDLSSSHQSDLTVPFMLMIIAHFYGMNLVKNLITTIGRYKKVSTGESVFYALFALNPAIRYLASFIMLFMVPILTINPYLFMAYSEVVMTYISAVVSVGFFIVFLRDGRKVKISQLLQNLEEDKGESKPFEGESLNYFDNVDDPTTTFFNSTESVFCSDCGLVIYDNAKECSNCGKKVES